jgi:hypothetical protein
MLPGDDATVKTTKSCGLRVNGRATNARARDSAGHDVSWIEGGTDRFLDAGDTALVDGNEAFDAVRIFEPQFPGKWKRANRNQGQGQIGLPKRRVDGVGNLGTCHESKDAPEQLSVPIIFACNRLVTFATPGSPPM